MTDLLTFSSPSSLVPPIRKLSILVLTILAIGFGADVTHAQTTFAELSQAVKAPNAIAKIGTDLFGDQVNLYTGSLEFVQSDISLRGNSALQVSAGRRLVTGVRINSYGPRQFGLWELEIPRIHGAFSDVDGWKVWGANPNARCSAFSEPRDVYANGAYWNASEFWQGSFMYIPGQGDQQLLSRDLANNNVPSPSSSYPVVTPKFWSISCLPSLANAPTLGEGFLATSPEGTKYRFDHMVSFGMESIGKSSASGGMMTTMEVTAQLDVGGTPSPQIGVDHSLARNEIYIFPTEVTDRFGNWVRYTYDPANPKNVTTITSSDGRQLTFTYGYGWTSHLITAITDGTRTWTYAYNAAVQGLSTVTLPDASTWNLANIYPLLANVNPQSMGCDNASTLNATAIAGSMVHPSGATGSFTLTRKVHGRSDVPQVCAGGLTPYAAIPRHLHTFSLTGKAITGPGLPPAGYTWSYAYGVPNASWAPCGAGCPKSKTVTVTDPNLDVTRYTFGNQYRISEGRLEQVDLGWVAATSTAQRTTTTRYRAAGLGPYPSMLGYGGELISDGESLAKLMPVDQVVTTQQGASFTWQANAFDAFARATSVTRFNTLGASRTEATVYTDNPGVWVLGQVESVTVSGSPSAMVPTPMIWPLLLS